MTKYYMTVSIGERLEVLKSAYRKYCLMEDTNGRKLTYSVAAQKRHATKRDIQSLVLIRKLLEHWPDNEMIDDVDSVQYFEHLVNPRTHHNKEKQEDD